ncbi:beta-L-arabinofuranosidase domain-containing protein, partial [Pantoea ananatis]
EVIELIAAAQCEDGYLNTYFTVKAPQDRWTNLAECHELYCAGHMIEAGVAFYQATGKRRLLEVVCRLADHIDSVFGPEEHQLHGYPGHPEIELALMRLYEVTQQPRYLA